MKKHAMLFLFIIFCIFVVVVAISLNNQSNQINNQSKQISSLEAKNNYKYEIHDKSIIREDINGMKEIVYKGDTTPTSVIVYKNSVIVAIKKKAFKSPDGLNLAGGGNTVIAYEGKQKITAMTVFKDTVVTAFNGNTIYASRNGLNLGSGRIYTARKTVKELVVSNYPDHVGINVIYSETESDFIEGDTIQP